MKWSDLKGIIGKSAVLLGTLLGGPAGATVGGLIASVLGVENEPQKVYEALKADPQAIVKIKELELSHAEKLRELAIQQEKNRLEAETARLAEINKTMRTEAQAEDKYVRRWRPTFGYAVAITWVLQTLAILGGVVYSTVSSPDKASVIIGAISQMLQALTLQWTVALGVLGINVVKRSQDKQVLAGQAPQSFLSFFDRK